MNQKIVAIAVSFLFTLVPFELLCAQDAASDLTQFSLEELMNIQVYSAAKKEERLMETASAVYVITSQDIRRSGATTIPELLRMVPGITVQKIDSNTWDVSARGFVGSIYSNKLLVLIDGRAIHSSLYGGVFWDVQDIMLEDIDRIEVIRGPGGTLWGANAVNGVINIISKKPADTQGTLVSGGVGSEERGFISGRYGAKSGDWYYRSYARFFDRDEGYRADGNNVDDWHMAKTGFRAENEHWNFQGDFYDGNIGQRTNVTSFVSPYTLAINESADVKGWNLLSRYSWDNWQLQMYWHSTQRDSVTFNEKRDRLDMEVINRFALTDNQEINWGGGYRLELEDFDNTPTISLDSPDDIDQVFNFFVQDEIKLDEKLKLIVGSKFEYNIYTGLELQPNIRTLYSIDETNMVWAAISRAVRTPTRLQTDSQITGFSPTTGTFNRIIATDEFDSEEMISYEMGYRTQPNEDIFFDLSIFSSLYEDIITFDRGATITDQGFSVNTFPFVNGMEGEVYGAEIASDITLTNWWKIKGAYTWSKMFLHTQEGIAGLGLEANLEAALPSSTAYLRSSFNLPYQVELDTTVRYMESARGIPSVVELDINISKEISGWRLSVVGQNLIEAHHKEATGIAATEVQRGGYVKITREF